MRIIAALCLRSVFIRLHPWLFAASVAAADVHWPQFRGPRGDGHSTASDLPVEWSEEKNVVWKSSIPGEAWSSPVIYGDQIWMTTAVDAGKSLRAIGVNKESGEVIHNLELFQVENPGFKHALNSYASPTPVIEKDRVYLSFGNFGNACVSTATGEVLWKSQALKLEHENGPGSSPIIYRDLFILHCDGTNVQYIAALHKETGKLAWKTERSGRIDKAPPMKKAYCTPLVIDVDGRDQLISPAAEHVYSYEPSTGRELWFVKYPGFSNVPRPIFGHGLVYVCTGFGKPEIWAIRPTGQGDCTDTHVAWKTLKGAPAKPSPILVEDRLFMIADNGVLTCLNPKTGDQIWQERIGGEFSASPIYANGYLYFFSHAGKTIVIKPAGKLEVVRENELESGFMASPAVSGKALYLRTKTHLYRLEKPGQS